MFSFVITFTLYTSFPSASVPSNTASIPFTFIFAILSFSCGKTILVNIICSLVTLSVISICAVPSPAAVSLPGCV